MPLCFKVFASRAVIASYGGRQRKVADGVAVRRVGTETFRVARRHVDEMVLATTDETCAAIQSSARDKGRIDPVIHRFVSARRTIALATSSGVPKRRIGICATILSVPGDKIAVSISPGEMEFTRMPKGPKSEAISRVNPASAAFDVE